MRTVPVDALTLFGLFAVAAMLVCYALEDRSPCSFWPSRAPARSALPMAFYRARGRSAWWRRSGP